MAALLAGVAPLLHAAVVHGVVRLDGQPVPGVIVSAETDEDGTFVVTLGVRGPLRITASAPGRQPDIRKLALAEEKELTFVLLPACSAGP